MENLSILSLRENLLKPVNCSVIKLFRSPFYLLPDIRFFWKAHHVTSNNINHSILAISNCHRKILFVTVFTYFHTFLTLRMIISQTFLCYWLPNPENFTLISWSTFFDLRLLTLFLFSWINQLPSFLIHVSIYHKRFLDIVFIDRHSYSLQFMYYIIQILFVLRNIY